MQNQKYTFKDSKNTPLELIDTIDNLKDKWFETLIAVEKDDSGRWVEYNSWMRRFAENDYYMNIITGEVDTQENWEKDFIDSIEKYFSYDEKYLFTHFLDNKKNIIDFFKALKYNKDDKFQDILKINNSNSSFLAISVNIKTEKVQWQIKINKEETQEIGENFEIALNNYHIIKNWLKNNINKITQTISSSEKDLENLQNSIR